MVLAIMIGDAGGCLGGVGLSRSVAWCYLSVLSTLYEIKIWIELLPRDNC